jgi:hypothetical protein
LKKFNSDAGSTQFQNPFSGNSLIWVQHSDDHATDLARDDVVCAGNFWVLPSRAWFERRVHCAPSERFAAQLLLKDSELSMLAMIHILSTAGGAKHLAVSDHYGTNKRMNPSVLATGAYCFLDRQSHVLPFV